MGTRAVGGAGAAAVADGALSQVRLVVQFNYGTQRAAYKLAMTGMVIGMKQ